MFSSPTINFLKELKSHNNKAWFDEHRFQFEKAKEEQLAFAEALISRIGEWDGEVGKLRPKDTIFRIYRDVRFSKDKTPYKTHLGLHFSGGNKEQQKAGYYFHLEPGDTFLGGGCWEPLPQRLKDIRQEIDYNLEEFESIVRHPDFIKYFGELGGSKLQKTPRDYPKDHPGMEWLKHKDFIGTHQLKDESLLISKDLLDYTIKVFQALRPLNEFLNRSLD